MMCVYLITEAGDAKAVREKDLARKYSRLWMDKALKSKGQSVSYSVLSVIV